MATLRNSLPDSRMMQWDALVKSLQELQAEVQQLLGEAAEFPTEGLRPTWVRKRDRVLERAHRLLDAATRLLSRIQSEEAADSHGRRCETVQHADWKSHWRRLRRRVDELKEAWRLIRNEEGSLVMETLVLDLGTGD